MGFPDSSVGKEPTCNAGDPGSNPGWGCGFYRMMHGSVSDPSFCAFVHRVAFEEGSGPRVLLNPQARGLAGLPTQVQLWGPSAQAKVTAPPDSGGR